jgi:zinc protease
MAFILALAPMTARSAPAKSEPPALAPLPIPDIAYTRVVLKNGLTLIVHEDHKAPIVAVNLWYHVGSKDEPPGRTGFAHLFEHLMFGSTGGNQRGWFERLESVGATGINGTTANDRTNFFETVPTPALDMTLAMEAGRMGHLLDHFDAALLTTQRGVVQNEKRQGENQPYAVSDEIVTKSVWPAGHPYSHTVIGEMTDLDAAKVEDVKDWFGKYYGPNNAVLAMSGDITPQEARAKALKWFGAIPPGPAVAHQKVWIAKRSGEQRAVAQDHVPQTRLYFEWNVPPEGEADADRLDLLSSVLTEGKDSRLYRRLVYQDQIATDVQASLDAREIGSLMDIEITVKDGVAPGRAEAAFHEELDRLLREGPTAAELDRHKATRLAEVIRGIERVGGFGGQADILAESQTYMGDPGAWRTSLARFEAATPEEVAQAGRRWLTDGAFVLEVDPMPKLMAAPGPAQAIPPPGDPLAPRFPGTRSATLSNGLKVVVAERHETPEVVFQLVLNGGDAADPAGMAGLASLDAATTLDGAGDLDALAFDDRKLALGVSLNASSGRDSGFVTMTALSARVDPALDLLADVILRPAFRPQDVARERNLALAKLEQSRQDPFDTTFRLLPALVYGPDHPYGRLVTEASLAAITPDSLARHHGAWFQPAGATLVVVGDTTLEAILPKLEAHLGAWKATVAPPSVAVPPVTAPAAPRVFLVDKPGALQSTIAAGVIAPSKLDPDDIASQAMITTLGGAFTSRLNMNLREDKHWAYGAFAFILDAKGPGLFAALAPVQTDRTKESFQEVRRELTDVVGTRPPTAAELELSRRNLTLTLPGRWETNAAVARSLGEVAGFGLPADYYQTYAGKVDALGVSDLARAADRVVKPQALTWVIVGDKTKILAPLQSLGLEVTVVDADGKPAP